MSVKTAELAETPASADDFHALEEKIIRTIEMLKTARAEKAAAERELRRVRGQVGGRHDETESPRREVTSLWRGRREALTRGGKKAQESAGLSAGGDSK